MRRVALPRPWPRNVASLRRRTDSEEEDYRSARRSSPFNGHVKWVVGTVGTVFVAALMALVARDRASIDRDQGVQDTRLTVVERAVTELATAQAADQATTIAFSGEVLRSLEELKADMKEVKRELRR